VGEAEKLSTQLLAGLHARFKRPEGLDEFANERLGLANHPRFGDRRMFHQGARPLKRTHHMPRGLDNVIGASDELEIAIGIAFGEIAREIPAAHKALPVAYLVVQVATKHRRPAGFERQFAHQDPGITSLSGLTANSIARLPGGDNLSSA
jgi:hypothetical protein